MKTWFDLCDRATILAYLGRPQVKKSHRIDQEVVYLRTGTRVPKTHTFRRRLSAKKGYLELFGLGILFINDEGKWYFKLHHTRQETLDQNYGNVTIKDEIPPSPSPLPENERVIEQKGSIDNFSLPLYTIQRHNENNVSSDVDSIENVDSSSSLIGRERNSTSESNRKPGKVDAEQLLTAQEMQILKASRDPGG